MSQATGDGAQKPRARHISRAQSRCQGKGRTVKDYIGSLPATYRRKIKKLFKERGGYLYKSMNADKRALLSECVFEVVNDLEHRHVNRQESQKPQAVGALFEAMNHIYDDLGWHEMLKAEG